MCRMKKKLAKLATSNKGITTSSTLGAVPGRVHIGIVGVLLCGVGVGRVGRKR